MNNLLKIILSLAILGAGAFASAETNTERSKRMLANSKPDAKGDILLPISSTFDNLPDDANRLVYAYKSHCKWLPLFIAYADKDADWGDVAKTFNKDEGFGPSVDMLADYLKKTMGAKSQYFRFEARSVRKSIMAGVPLIIFSREFAPDIHSEIRDRNEAREAAKSSRDLQSLSKYKPKLSESKEPNGVPRMIIRHQRICRIL